MARGKIKMRLKNKSGKTKRWRKGHSSDSNPSIHSHRESAKNRFFNINTGPSQLTTDALAKHDQAVDEDNEMDTVSDTRSEGGLSAKSFSTWATNWTDCTNATFSKVHRFWGSGTALHKEILAVLAAVTDVIKTQGGSESETSYFAALMTTLETVEDDISLTAVTYLLELAIKRVPPPVLKSRFAEVSKALMTTLASHTETDMPALLKSLLLCLAHLLRVQDASIWSYSSTTQLYNGLLAFTISHKPKVRKAAQHAVRLVLKGSTFMTSPHAPEHHPAAPVTAKYCVQQIETSGGSADSTVTFYILGLLQNILAAFPLKSLKHTCETMLKVMTLANVIVTSTALKTLNAMFLAEPKETSLSAELNAQIINALYDYQPSESDTQQMSAWLTAMEQAHLNLYRINTELCLGHVAKLFVVCVQCLQSSNQALCQIATKTAKSLLKHCVQPSIEYLKRSLSQTSQNSAIYKMFKAAEAGLSYQYHASWDLVLQILTTFFEVASKECPHIMKKCLLSMADLRDSYRFAYQRELDGAVGVAVRRMGPRLLLEAVPLNITGVNDNLDFPRSWLLPVMRENIRETEIGFFASYFLPLASKLRTIAIEHAKKEEQVQAKTYDALQMQMWSLLPGFCTEPTDFTQSFKDIARYLGMALTDRPDLRLHVMASLRKLVKQSAEDEAMKSEMGRFSKNYLPILFNLYSQDSQKERDPVRNAVLDTVLVYLSICDEQLTFSYFDRCMSKLDEADITGHKQHAYLDLTTAMIPYLGEDRLAIIYKWVLSKLKSTDKTLQKKSYKALQILCGADSQACRTFVKTNLSDLQENVVTSLSTSSLSSKGPRLKCLLNIFKQLDDPQTEFITAVIPEAVACVKAQAERPRKAAYTLLVELGHLMVRWADGDEEQGIEDYLNMLLGGLHGHPQLAACTLLTISHVVYEFRASIKKHLLAELMEHVTRLLRSKSREIVVSTLGLVKILLAWFSDSDLAAHLQTIVSSLVSMEADNKHHFRFKAKEIYQKLVKKFGYDIISGMVPEEQQKQLRNIRKTTERAKRKKQEKSREEEEDDDEDASVAMPKVESMEDLLKDSDSEMEEDKGPSDKKRKAAGKSGQAWLREGGEEDIVDFLDTSVSKKVLATKPGQETQRKVKHAFKTSTDGRLIITDKGDDDSESAPKPSRRKAAKRRHEEEDDDLEDLLDAISGDHLKNKKKKTPQESVADDNDFGDDETGSTSTGYKPGGHGIHRPLEGDEKPIRTKTAKPGAEYRAKKAGGDIKRKDKPDPYAYIPLEMKLLNKRKRAKAAGQFKNLVTGARKGAKKGMKHRTKNKK